MSIYIESIVHIAELYPGATTKTLIIRDRRIREDVVYIMCNTNTKLSKSVRYSGVYLEKWETWHSSN